MTRNNSAVKDSLEMPRRKGLSSLEVKDLYISLILETKGHITKKLAPRQINYEGYRNRSDSQFSRLIDKIEHSDAAVSNSRGFPD